MSGRESGAQGRDAVTEEAAALIREAAELIKTSKNLGGTGKSLAELRALAAIGSGAKRDAVIPDLAAENFVLRLEIERLNGELQIAEEEFDHAMTERAKPAASDLVEWARRVISYTGTKAQDRLVERIIAEFATQIAAAKAEGWDDAVKALQNEGDSPWEDFKYKQAAAFLIKKGYHNE